MFDSDMPASFSTALMLSSELHFGLEPGRDLARGVLATHA
jgi:hypothetical protein